MNAHYRGQSTIIIVVVCLLMVTLTMTAFPRAVAAQSQIRAARPGEGVSIRIEGYLKAIGPDKWFVGEHTILIDAQTIVIEKRGRAEVGAWVVVWGIQNENGSIYGELIQVDRPAGRNGPILQFSGLVTKQVDQGWIVGEMLVEITDTTQIIGAPGLGWLVWVVAEDQGTTLRAIVVEAIADDPAAVPLEFEGILEAIEPGGGQVDGYAFILAGDAQIIGEPAVGMMVEVKATRSSSGILVAHLLRVVDAYTEAGMGALAATSPDEEGPLHVAASAAPWETPELVIGGLVDASRPVLTGTGDGTLHALWESGGNIFWAFRSEGHGWSQARRLATGTDPATAVDNTGQLHVVFANQFNRNYEIYHITYTSAGWTLPTNVARTSGVSAKPALAADDEGKLYATWMDDSPGYWIIYVANWSGRFWSNQPLPYARGQLPAITVSASGTVFLAWQDRVPVLDNPTGLFDIFLSQRETNSWSLPINVSDRTDTDANAVSITTTADGMAHLVWIEDGQIVRYDFGRGHYWPPPKTIIQASVVVHGPRIVAENGYFLHIAWDEGEMLRATSAPSAASIWPKPVVVTALQGTLKDVSLTATQGSGVTLSWVQVSQPGGASIYESHYERRLSHRTWLPIILTGWQTR